MARNILIRVYTIAVPAQLIIEATFHEEYQDQINDFISLCLNKKEFAILCSPDYGEVLTVKHKNQL